MAERLDNKIGSLTALNQIASTLANLGREGEAWELFNQELALAQALGNRVKIGTALSNLGWLSEHRADYPSALRYYKESLQIFLALGDVWQVPFLRVNLGGVLVNLDRFNEAADQLFQAESHAKNEPDQNRGLLSNVYRILGELSYKQGDDEQAMDYFVSAAQISEIAQLQLLALTEVAVF